MEIEFDSEGFITNMELHLSEFADIALMIMKKQMKDLDIEAKTMTPDQAEVLITNVTSALGSFVGEEGAVLLKNILVKDLRKYAPSYFTEKYGIV